ncbi:hypothetical protein ELH21_10175 [Rhizobium leguminosarum]|uniref:hypothetical protein n=1 Tax=Rhizobium leguminosarum TaxID=384 RepID=UPI001030F9B9|nr:hypothetical protein [Rhizobium leguminosarum]TBD04739.1 hypothetical protein ELH21_10175 [Rhizobium leguminosarum]
MTPSEVRDAVAKINTFYAIIGNLIEQAENDQAKSEELRLRAEEAVREMKAFRVNLHAEVSIAIDRGVKSAHSQFLNELSMSIAKATDAAKNAKIAYQKAASFAMWKVSAAATVVGTAAIVACYLTLQMTPPPFVSSSPTVAAIRNLATECQLPGGTKMSCIDMTVAPGKSEKRFLLFLGD